MTRPRPVRYASRIPDVPKMIAAVGKSGPGTCCMISSMVIASLSMYATQAFTISVRLCGGMLVAMPTAMPDEPLISRFGSLAGITSGSCSLPS